MPSLKKVKRFNSASKPKNSSSGWTYQGNKFYQKTEWRKLRANQLKAVPYCQYCKKEDNRIQKATVADHLRPIRLFPELALDPNNLRSSCKRHHNQKNPKSKVYDRESFELIIKKERWDQL